jgi:hypothetical protein
MVLALSRHRGVLLVADFAFAPSDSQLGQATATYLRTSSGWLGRRSARTLLPLARIIDQ